MRTGDYWKSRFELIEQAGHRKGVECYAEIEQQYREAQKSVEQQIAAWYQRFAKNNEISMTEARKLLSERELKEFKWDVKDYIRYGEENALNGQWMKQLENASARYHISRLEVIQTQMQQQIEVAFGNQLDSLDKSMREIYMDGYYHTTFEIQKGAGVGWDFATLDQKRIDKIINKPWAQDGKNFSSRVWTNKQKLVQELNTTLTQGIVLGKDPRKVIDAIADRLRVSKSVAGRLVMTESAAFASASQQDCFKDLGVEQYKIIATLDSHTSEVCQEMDGKVFKMSEWAVGVTAPPFHVWCRSTTVPYFDDEFSLGERAAKGEDGKTYYVPSDMTYKEWKAAMVNGQTGGLHEVGADSTIKAEAEPSEVRKLLEESKIKSLEVKKLKEPLSEDEIISKLAGGDMTKGSCSSVAFAYTGNKNGLDVTDFRGGESQAFFSTNSNIIKIGEISGINCTVTEVEKELAGAMDILKNSLELGHEYYFAAGRHAAIVRRLEDDIQYLEMQSAINSGWTSFTKNRYGSMYNTLYKRFGCRKTVDQMKVAGTKLVFKKKVILIDVDSFADNDEFAKVLSYLNTATDVQKKGVLGSVK